MKKSIIIIILCTLGALQARPVAQEDVQLKDLEKKIYERSVELPELKKQLKQTAKGSEDARRLRTKINQYEEFITTGQAELDARRKKPSLVQIPVALPTAQVPVQETPIEQTPSEEIVYKDVTVIPEPLPVEQPEVPQGVYIDTEVYPEIAPAVEEIKNEVAVVIPVAPALPIEQPKVEKGTDAALLEEIRKGTTLRPVTQPEEVPVVEEVKKEAEVVAQPEIAPAPALEQIEVEPVVAPVEVPALPAQEPIIKPIKPILITPITQLEKGRLMVEIPAVETEKASLVAEIRGGNKKQLSVKGEGIQATIGKKRMSTTVQDQETALKKRRMEINK